MLGKKWVGFLSKLRVANRSTAEQIYNQHLRLSRRQPTAEVFDDAGDRGTSSDQSKINKIAQFGKCSSGRILRHHERKKTIEFKAKLLMADKLIYLMLLEPTGDCTGPWIPIMPPHSVMAACPSSSSSNPHSTWSWYTAWSRYNPGHVIAEICDRSAIRQNYARVVIATWLRPKSQKWRLKMKWPCQKHTTPSLLSRTRKR